MSVGAMWFFITLAVSSWGFVISSKQDEILKELKSIKEVTK